MEAFTALVRRQSSDGTCQNTNGYDGRLGLRVSAVFVIMFSSTFGAFFPLAAKRFSCLRLGGFTFTFAKYFGSGVIVATAFIHLLAPANNELKDPCLTGAITDYDWPEGIALMAVFVMFYFELLAMRKLGGLVPVAVEDEVKPMSAPQDEETVLPERDIHMSHAQDHQAPDANPRDLSKEKYTAQLLGMYILEFGVIFHSVIIGLTLAVSGKEFDTLYVVLVFHQMFEGLGLGSRIAVLPWERKWLPWCLAGAYGLTTPISIAVGLGLREAFNPSSPTALIVSGVLDSISAGILLYTGMVELMAHEFLFSDDARALSAKRLLLCVGIMTLGAGLMALLGKWA